MITKKIYFKIGIRLASPLAVGSGENSNTDSDVILDSRGQPVIPATSLAGTIRHFLEDTVKAKFGIWGSIENGSSISSRIRFFDAILTSDSFISVRDSVALENKISDEADEGEILHNKVGVSGAKFDKEIVEAEADFVSLLELHDVSDEEKSGILLALSAINSGFLRIGSKTTRGYGQFKITSLKEADFTFPDDREKWLGFDQFDFDSDDCYTDITEKLNEFGMEKYYDIVKLRLRQKGALSIRSYTIKDITAADYIQLSDKDGTPVIPGTSWAGAFRNRFKELSGSSEVTNQLFGFVNTKSDEKKKSKIFFGESRIKNAERKLITRNSIDRFSGGVKDKALYSEITFYNGETVLEIFISKQIKDIEKVRILLSAVICDLHKGYLGIGGLTSVGRGLFEIMKMEFNGIDVTKALEQCDISKMMGDDIIG